MKYLLSPTESDLSKAFGDRAIVSSLPEEKGADILSYTKQGLIGVQRKSAPQDLLASIEDGRLVRETTLLPRECKFPLILVEGRLKYWPDGHLVISGKKLSAFTRKQIRGILFDVKYIKGVDYDFTDSIEDTVNYVDSLTAWMSSGKHWGLFNRPSMKSTWYVPSSKEIHLWLLQSFSGVGPTTAEKIITHFRGIPIRWTCTLEELLAVPGLSKNKAAEMYAALPGFPGGSTPPGATPTKEPSDYFTTLRERLGRGKK